MGGAEKAAGRDLVVKGPSADERSPDLPLDRSALDRLLARLPIGIVSVNTALDVEYVNPAALVYLGPVAVGALLPDSWPGFSLRKFAGRLFGSMPPVRQLVETPAGYVLEVDGIPAAATGSGLVILTDVTASERRRRAEEEFVANAAHELRTPIAAISSSLEVLRSGAKNKPEDRDLFLGHIERESERLERLAGTLLLLARIQTRQEKPSLVLVELAPLLEEIAGQLQPKGDVQTHVACSAELAVLADSDLLRQAIWNVAANAVSHTSEGEIELMARSLGTVCEIEVHDTGSGMTEAEQERVFDRFFRGGRRAGGGFGLGLPIAREIVRVLSGTITIDSRVGVGTRVTFRLPTARVVRE